MYVKEKIVLAQEAISKSFACKKIKNGDVILIYSWWVYFYLLGLAAMTDISGSCVNPFRTKTPKYLFLRGKDLYFIIKLAAQISLFSLQISKTWCFV